jgi:hypothetical protein
MPPRPSKDSKARQRVIEGRGIRFRPYPEPEKWPRKHETLFRHINTLGSTSFDAWNEEICARWREMPWKIDTRERAKLLCQQAQRCCDENENERGWRSKLEPIVFRRLEIEVNWLVEIHCLVCSNKSGVAHHL